MNANIKKAVEEYQCSGCMSGSDISCFKTNNYGGDGCGEHYPGTKIGGIGTIFLGLPKGFNRIGEFKSLKPIIYEKFDDCYDLFNVPVWKYLNEDNHTLVRGMMPRRNEPFLHIFLEDCMDKITCTEISKEDIDNMD